MSDPDFPLLDDRPAAEIAQSVPLGPEARALLTGGPTPKRYVDTLVDRGLFHDAVRFLAHALRKREAVWWACRCARAALGVSPLEPEAAALASAEQWVAEPVEANRREAESAAQASGLATPSGLAAMAAFWSGGSLTPANLPEVPPADHLCARGVAGAVLLAALSGDAAGISDRFRRFLHQGLAVAAGSDRWDSPAPTLPAEGSSPDLTPRPAPTRTPSRAARRLDTWE